MAVTTQVRFGVLGPLEVHRGRDLAEVTRPKLRGLLGLLLLERNRVVPRSRLIDALWGEAPPATVDAALHSLVSEARRVVGSDALITQAPGYLLRVEPAALDLARFEELHDQARQALAAGRADEALRLSDEALGLWRGEPLADCLFDEAVRGPMVASIRMARMAVQEDRFEAALACGRHREVVGELARLVAEDPLRERMRGLLMLGLYRSGRASEALAVYRDGYTAMTDSLGITPSPALQALERSILRHDASLDAPDPASAVSSPNAAVAAPRRGRQAIWPVVIAIALVGFIAVALAAVVWSSSGGGSTQRAAGPYGQVPDAVFRSGFFDINPTTNKVVRWVAFRDIQDGLAIGFRWRWIATSRGVEKVDPNTGKVREVVPLPGGANSVVVAGHWLWATSNNTLPPSYVYPIKPTNPTMLLHPFKVGNGGEIQVLHSGAGYLWELGVNHLTQIDPNNPAAIATIPVHTLQPANLHWAMTFGGGSAWLIDEDTPPPGHSQGWGTLYRLNPRTHRITRRIAIPNPLGSRDHFDLYYGAGGVWVADGLRSILWEINPVTYRRTQPIRHLPPFDSYAVRPGQLWMVGSHLVEVQLGSGTIVHSYRLPGRGGSQSMYFVGNLLEMSYGGG